MIYNTKLFSTETNQIEAGQGFETSFRLAP